MALNTFSPNTKIKSSEINSNFAGLVDMSLVSDGAVASRHIPSSLISTSHIANAAITPAKMGGIITTSGHLTTAVTGVSTSWTDLITITPTVTKNNAQVLILAEHCGQKVTNAGWVAFRLTIDGDTAPQIYLETHSASAWWQGSIFHQAVLSAGSHTIKTQGYAENATANFNVNHNVVNIMLASRVLFMET